MQLAIVRAGTLVLASVLLQSCGGGGGDSNGGGNPPPPQSNDARLELGARTLTAAATPGHASPNGQVAISIANPPADGVFLFGEYTNTGIETVEFAQMGSSASGTLTVRYRSPNVLQDDEYVDTITLRACLDEDCTDQIDGSPATIRSTYTVSGDGLTAMLDTDIVEVSADTHEQSFRIGQANITLSAPVETPIHVERTFTTNALVEVNWLGGEQVMPVEMHFTPSRLLSAGRFTDTITLKLCYDPSCIREVAGSPMTLTAILAVNAAPEPGVAPLEVASRIALPHDVVDAEFDRVNNRIVMVSRRPADAIYVYDVATGVEVSQALVKAPSAVAVSPDGATAAVGQDALISVFDLAQLGTPGAPAPTLLNVQIDVFDLVLDGHGNVHAIQELQTWDFVHSVDIATNTETLSTGLSVWGGAHMRLHPSGNYLFLADIGLSPDELHKVDITTVPAAYLYNSPYHGDHSFCGNAWLDDAGARAYTACGNTFQLSDTPNQDILYLGSLPLAEGDHFTFQVESMSLAAARNELALIEYDAHACGLLGKQEPCYSHLAYHEADFLRRLGVFSIPPITIGETAYDQFGLFVFHDAISARKYVISLIEDAPDPASEYYLSVVE